MSANLSILVKNESAWVRAGGILWLFRLFQKSKMRVVIDGVTQELVAQEEPYSFSIAPGVEHTVNFIDPRGKAKRRGKAFGTAVIGAAMGLGATGSGLGMVSGALIGTTAFSGKRTKEGYLFTVAEGDTLRLSCKATGKGEVKVTQL